MMASVMMVVEVKLITAIAVIQIQTLLPPLLLPLLLSNPLTTTTPLLLPHTGTAQSMAKSNKRKQKIAPNAFLV